MSRVLIVSPHFPPLNAPDMQRVRMSLPHFVSAGWDVTVLTVDDPTPLAPVEAELRDTVPAQVRVVPAYCCSRRWTRWLGVNNIALRSLPFLFFTGCRLLRAQHFDVIYFSTTMFIVLPMGRIWRWFYGVPYVVDLQDPWVSDYYDRPGAPPPPGGWKYRFASASARLLEGWTLSQTAHVLSVSEHYLANLDRRYPWWTAERGSVLTFGTPDADFALVRRTHRERPALLPAGSGLRIAYAGRLGADMLAALDVLFAAVAQLQTRPRSIELFFYGTSYAGAGRARSTTGELAIRHGISHLVHEQPGRIGYLASIRLLLETDIALILGSTDAAYSPSKIYPTLLAARPTLALAPAGSVLADLVADLGGANLTTFQPQSTPDMVAVNQLVGVLDGHLRQPEQPLGPPLNSARLHDQHSSATVAERQLAILRRAIAV